MLQASNDSSHMERNVKQPASGSPPFQVAPSRWAQSRSISETIHQHPELQEGVRRLQCLVLRDWERLKRGAYDTLPCSLNKFTRTHVFTALGVVAPLDSHEGDVTIRKVQWWVGRNTELSAPCGTQCAERNTIATYINHQGALENIRYLLLTSFVDHNDYDTLSPPSPLWISLRAHERIGQEDSQNRFNVVETEPVREWLNHFILPCGVCREELWKLSLAIEKVHSAHRSEGIGIQPTSGRDHVYEKYAQNGYNVPSFTIWCVGKWNVEKCAGTEIKECHENCQPALCLNGAIIGPLLPHELLPDLEAYNP